MGEPTPPGRKFWHTTFAKALGLWLMLAMIGMLTLIPLFEMIGYLPYKLLLAAMGLGALVLIGWSVWRFARRPRSGWVSPIAVVATAAIYVALVVPVANAGLFLNFLRHKPGYDKIVADAKAGRLRDLRTVDGMVVGVRHGERFQLARERPLLVHFEGWWAGDYDVFEIYYDEENCPGRNGGRPTRAAGRDGEPQMLMLGYTLHLAGHYCLRKLTV